MEVLPCEELQRALGVKAEFHVPHSEHDSSIISQYYSFLEESNDDNDSILSMAVTSEDNCVCCVCGENFHFLDNLIEHFNSHKTEVRCHLCQAKFNSVMPLALHLKNAHQNQHLCKICGVLIKCTWHLNEHLEKHLQEVMEKPEVEKYMEPTELKPVVKTETIRIKETISKNDLSRGLLMDHTYCASVHSIVPLRLKAIDHTYSGIQNCIDNYANTINNGSHLANIKTENERLPPDFLPESAQQSKSNIVMLQPISQRGEMSGSSIMLNQDLKVESVNEDGFVECEHYKEVVVEEFEMKEDEESTETSNDEDSDYLPAGDTEYSPGEDLSSDVQYSAGIDNDESVKKRFHANHSMDTESVMSTGKIGLQADSPISMVNMENCKSKPTFACCLCKVVCENEDFLLKHTAEYHPAAIFICAYCLNIFSKEDAFKNHVCSRPTGYMNFLPATPVTPVPVVPLSDLAKQHSTSHSSQTLLPTPILGTNYNTIKMITLAKTFEKLSKNPLPNQCDPPLSLPTLKSTSAPSSLQITQFHNYANTIEQGLHLPKIKTENKQLPLDSLPESEVNIFTLHPVTWRGEKSGSSIMSNQDVKVENNNEDGPAECGPYEEVVVKGKFEMTEGEVSTESGTREDSDSLFPGNTVCNPGEDLSSDLQNSIGPDNEESMKKRSHANHRINPESFTSTENVSFQVDSSIFCTDKLVSTEKHTEDCKHMPTFACCLCQVICENEGVLLKHTAEYHPTATLLCSYCLNIFSKEVTFRNHVCCRPTGHTSFLPATPLTPVPVVPSSDPAKPHSTDPSSQKLHPTPILGTKCNKIKMITLSEVFDNVSNTPLPNQFDRPLSLITLKSTNPPSSLQISQFHNYTNTINQDLHLPKIKTENERLPLDSLPESEANIFTHDPVTWREEKSGSSIMSNQDVKVENYNEDCLVECGPYDEMVVERKFEMTEDEENTESGTGTDSKPLTPGNTVSHLGEDLSLDSQYFTGPNNDESIKKRTHANQRMYPESLMSTGKVGFQADSSFCSNGKLVNTERHSEDCKKKPTLLCCLCQVVCENENFLLKHTAEYHPAAIFICSYCLNIFSKEDTFRNHVCSRPTGYMSFLPATPVTPVPAALLSDPANTHSNNPSSQRILPTRILGTNCNTIKMVTLSKSFDKVSKTPLTNQCDPPLSLPTLRSTNADSSLQISQFHNYTNTIKQGLHLPKIKTENERLPLDSLPESEDNIFTPHPVTWRGEKSGSSIMSDQNVKVENNNEDGPAECGPYEEVVVKGEFEMTEGEESTESGTGVDSDSLLPGNTLCNPGEALSSDSQNSIVPDNEELIKKRCPANRRMNPESFKSTGKVGFQVDSSIFCYGKLVSTEKHTEDCKNMPTFACCLCQVICENEGVLLKHTAEYHPTATLLCSYCLNIFSKENTFRNHVCSRPTSHTSILPATPLTSVPVVPLSDPSKPHSTNPRCQRRHPTPILGTKCNTIKMITLSKTFEKLSKNPLPNQCDPPLPLPTLKSTNAPSSLQITQFHNYTNTINQGLHLPKMKTENERLPFDSLPESEANIFTHHPVTWRVKKSGSSIMSNQDVKVENDNEDCLVEREPYEEMLVEGEFEMTDDEESTESGTRADIDALTPGNTVSHLGEDLRSDSQYSSGPNNDESIKKRTHANQSMNPESLNPTGKVGFQADSSIRCNGKLVSTEKPTLLCCLCQEGCENEGLLLKHTAEYHPAAIYICAYCLNIFSKEDAFRNHVCSRPTGYISFLPATPVTPVPVVPLSDPAFTYHSIQRILPTPILGNAPTQAKIRKEISPLFLAKFTPHGVAVPQNFVSPPCPPGSSVFGPDVPVCSPSVVRRTNPSLSNESRMILQIPTPSNQSLPTKAFVSFSPTVDFSAPVVVQANRNKPRLAPKQIPAANARPLQLPAKPPVSCPTLVSGIGQNNQPLVSPQTSPVQIQIPTSGPLEIVTMFLNKSKDLAQQKRLHQSWRSKTIFPCRQCGAISRQLSLRVRHRYLHQGTRLYKCQCGKSFQRQLHLLRHQVQHLESVLFVCGNKFEGAHKLSWHKQRLHRKHKTSNGRQNANKKCIAAFDCICGQVFSRPSALLWHMLKNAKPLKHKYKNDSGLNEPVSAV